MQWRLLARHAPGARGRPPGLPLLPLLFVALSPLRLPAQMLSGRLLDLEGDQPIAFGVLTLLAENGEQVAIAVTDSTGQWSLRAPQPGRYLVHATRMGYEAWVAGPVQLARGDVISSTFHLRRRPIALDPIAVTVAATRRHLTDAGFYHRQNGNFGHFIDTEEIDRRQARSLTELLVGIPGVTQVAVTSGSVGGRYVALRGSDTSRGGTCRPRVFVDGILYALGDSRPVRRSASRETEMRVEEVERVDQGLSLDDIGNPASIAAIEVYRSAAQVPAQFGAGSVGTLCGVIVVWTRRGLPGR